MSNQFDRRIRRLESRGRDPAAEDARRRQNERLKNMLARAHLSRQPELAQVTEADTDPETWRSIQETIARARGEYELYGLGRTTADREKQADHVRAIAKRVNEQAAEKSQRLRAALEAARRRLGLS